MSRILVVKAAGYLFITFHISYFFRLLTWGQDEEFGLQRPASMLDLDFFNFRMDVTVEVLVDDASRLPIGYKKSYEKVLKFQDENSE